MGNKYSNDNEFLRIIQNSQYYDPSFENVQINLTEKEWPTQSKNDKDNCGVYTCYYIHHIWNIIHKLQTYNTFNDEAKKELDISHEVMLQKNVFRVHIMCELLDYNSYNFEDHCWKNGS